MSETDYNGWENYETWNVALWIGNDEGLYNIARGCKSYEDFRQFITGSGCLDFQTPTHGLSLKTPDGVAWDDSKLDIESLDEMIEDLRN